MPHLSTDRLAELGDASASALEEAHFAECAECAAERDAYRALVAMAHAEKDLIGLPITRWERIAADLARDSAAVSSPAVTTADGVLSFARPRRPSRWPLQAAAALLLVAAGIGVGRTSAGADLLPRRPATAVASIAAPAARTPLQLAADSTLFSSVDDARMAQQQSELVYQQAAAFLAQHDTLGAGDGSPVAYRSRLAALDRVISTTREAMREAPHDPVINGYYLTTLGQREATLRQLNTTLPTSLRLTSF